MDIQYLSKRFLELYGRSDKPLHIYFAPGRVNIIGEHTDYNGGFVLPAAIGFGTYLLIRESNNNTLNFASENFPETESIKTTTFYQKSEVEWVNYPLGIIDQFNRDGKETTGIDCLYAGDIPPGAGLSSSASIELLTAFALNDLFDFNKEIIDLIHLSKKCEHEFIGVQCGIMDQFAVAMGEESKALYLNCKTLEHETIPFDLKPYQLVIVNSNKPRGLANSLYNDRVKECQQAVKDINKKMNIADLGQLDLAIFREVEHLIQHPVVRKRAFHVVNENYRVKEAVKVLEQNNINTFGKLLNASHKSLKDYYEVTGFELDALVEAAWQQEGVLGARMTGAGFGGCTVNFVHEDAYPEFKKQVQKTYKSKTGLEAAFYLPEIGNGVHRIEYM